MEAGRTIHEIFVVKNSGVLFFHENLSPSSLPGRFTDPLLLSSFFSGALNFFEQAAGSKIKRIIFEDHALVFHHKVNFYFVLLVDRFDCHHYLPNIMDVARTIADSFIAFYPELEAEDAGMPDRCAEFADFLPEILEEKFSGVATTEISENFFKAVAREI
ncbi:MAG: hypothetical protein ACTSU5_06810 [Promethearchaeota archaeon]